MKKYDDCQLYCTYEDAIILKESLPSLKLSDSFKRTLEGAIEYSEEKHNLNDYLKILSLHKEAELNAFNCQTLAEFRVDGGNYAYSKGNEFDAFIKSEKLREEGIKIFSGFFVSRRDPDEYEWSAALVNPHINLLAFTYGRKIEYLYLSNDDIQKGWVDYRRWVEFKNGEQL